MLGRKDYTQEELDHATSAIKQQLAAYRKLRKALNGAGEDPQVAAALESFDEPIVLIAGGRDKHLPWDRWAEVFEERPVHGADARVAGRSRDRRGGKDAPGGLRSQDGQAGRRSL